MLTICAFIVFFQILCALLSFALSSIGIGEGLRALCCGMVEVTQGARLSAFLPPPFGAMITVSLCNFGSLSVLLQVLFVTDGSFGAGFYLKVKLLCALFAPFLLLPFLRFC